MAFARIRTCLFPVFIGLITTVAAEAAVLVTWTQDGNDVLASYDGTMGINSGTGISSSAIHGASSTSFTNFATVISVAPFALMVNNPSSLTSVSASSYGGDIFGFTGVIYAGPINYTFSTTATGWLRFSNRTLAGMGATFETDFVALESTSGTPLVVYVANVPEPTTCTLLGVALLGGFAGLRRHRRTARVCALN